jgi:acetyltransferase EpsM
MFAVVGYSGHSYVVIDILKCSGHIVTAYCEPQPLPHNPYQLTYLGAERHSDTHQKLHAYQYFVAIGDNQLRHSITAMLLKILHMPCRVIHPSAVLAENIEVGFGTMIGAKAVINPFSNIGNGVICNTGSIVEHECLIGDFCHIAPGSVLCGNVQVGESTFIGANSVIKQGIKIGKNVTIGAGSVVVRDIPDGVKVVGHPARAI